MSTSLICAGISTQDVTDTLHFVLWKDVRMLQKCPAIDIHSAASGHHLHNKTGFIMENIMQYRVTQVIVFYVF